MYPLTQDHRTQTEIPSIEKITNGKLFLFKQLKILNLIHIIVHHFKDIETV